jgi:hypothetical protein
MEILMNLVNWIKHDESDLRLQPAYLYVPHESKYGWVLGWLNTEGETILVCKVWEDHENNLWHWVGYDGASYNPEEITHWMPLPKKTSRRCKTAH